MNLGDDWDLTKKTPSEIFSLLNEALIKEWEKKGYMPQERVTVYLPNALIAMLKGQKIGAAGGEIGLWQWLCINNSLAVNGIPFDILPREAVSAPKVVTKAFVTKVDTWSVENTNYPSGAVQLKAPRAEGLSPLFFEAAFSLAGTNVQAASKMFTEALRKRKVVKVTIEITEEEWP